MHIYLYIYIHIHILKLITYIRMCEKPERGRGNDIAQHEYMYVHPYMYLFVYLFTDSFRGRETYACL